MDSTFHAYRLKFVQQTCRIRKCIRFTDLGLVAFFQPVSGRHCVVVGEVIGTKRSSGIGANPLPLTKLVSKATLHRLQEALQKPRNCNENAQPLQGLTASDVSHYEHLEEVANRHP
ncbi:unnamed protein product [Mesocestoides corti]|nr:unnamed protein product [Mesocestoides corti]